MSTTSKTMPRIRLCLFLLSAATLTFEITLTRLFSVAQFYHFAFMIVSIALLGFGASGTVLTIFPPLQQGEPSQRLAKWSLGAGTSILIAYLLTNWLPFDSYSMIWDSRQVFILVLHYIALAAPFFFSGMVLGLLLTIYPQRAGSTYALNLLGSATGCVVALLAPSYLGGEGMVSLSCGMAIFAGMIILKRGFSLKSPVRLGAIILLLFMALDLGLRLTNQTGLQPLELHLSPYKGLSYTLQVPEAKVIYRQWNSFSRVDVVRSPGIHSVPGLSYRYLQALPVMDGLLVDGDDLSPMVPSNADPSFSAYLPAAIAYQLRPIASSLVLGPRGGIDIVTALSQGAGMVSAVEQNPLIVEAAPAYADARLGVYIESGRSYLQHSQWDYDVILLSLASSFHPVQSGAYTLAEDYRYTVESFTDMLAHLKPDGLLVATRWLQDPPSEDLRLFALAVAAVESSGGDPFGQIVAFRGYNTATILVKNGGFTPNELAMIREFTAQRAFDLSYVPGIQANETNLYNILPESKYYQTYLNLLDREPRQAFYDHYEYDVRPPTDDRPFYGHYFKWAQAPKILAEFGKAWLPFGGGGYFVILALLILATFLAGILILLPVWLRKITKNNPQTPRSPFLLRHLLYFALLGLAFLCVEIPLLQRFILYLGNPAYATTTVLFSLLLFSGLGSQCSNRLPLRLSLVALVILILVMPGLLKMVFAMTLGWHLAARLGMAVLILAPLGFLMGIPFPGGLHRLTHGQSSNEAPAEQIVPRSDIPWIWAVNGAASVISPILAALLALSFGFSNVLRVGAMCYTAALLTAWVSLRLGVAQRPVQ